MILLELGYLNFLRIFLILITLAEAPHALACTSWHRTLPLHYCGLQLESMLNDVTTSDFANPNLEDTINLQKTIKTSVSDKTIPPATGELFNNILKQHGDLEEVRYTISGLLFLAPSIDWEPTYDRPFNGKWNPQYLEVHILDQIPNMTPLEFLNFATLLRSRVDNPRSRSFPVEALFDPHRIVTFTIQIPANPTPGEVESLVEDLSFRIGTDIPFNQKHVLRYASFGIKVIVELPLARTQNLRNLITRASSVRAVSIVNEYGEIIDSWNPFPWDPIDRTKN